MYLKSIKLAGFKTFVDPITIPLSTQRTAVVGPNGCGKSNIIDAVRWVMGESSAKHLRGEAIADVIFNGSSTRKPVGQASIELLLDNVDGRLGGEYAAYSEISIKRQISRDGQSNYYLNNTRCRRRDIFDVFLGTGLGPRNYAIIEQGKTRLAEAKPEELRSDIEEAAGISKYKERRHETSLRIEHTRENLERLNDLRQEIDKQVSHLQKQADAADRYTRLKEEERNVRATLFAWRAHLLQTQLAACQVQVTAVEARFAVTNTENTHLNATIDALRGQLHQAQEEVSQQQATLHHIEIELTKLAKEKQHQAERKAKLVVDQTQAMAALKEAEQQVSADQLFMTQITLGLDEAKKMLAEREQQSQLAYEEELECRKALQFWQSDWDAFQKASAQTQTEADVEQTRISQLEAHLHTLFQQISRLEEERLAFKQQTQDEQESFGEQWEEFEAQIKPLQEQLVAIDVARTALQATHQNLEGEIKILEQQSQELRESYASMDALQQVALGQQNSLSTEWLKHYGLFERPRLAQLLMVAPGWERAIEVVLEFYLEAVCVEDAASLLQSLQALPEATLSILTPAKGALSPVLQNSALDLPLLLKQVTVPWSLGYLLSGVYTVESLEQAWSFREKLQAHESIVTQTGIWLGPNWLRISRQANEKTGVIQRERDLSGLKEQVSRLQAEITAKRNSCEETLQNKVSQEEQKQQIQQQLSTLLRQQAEIRGQWQAKKTEQERALQRLQQIDHQLAELAKEQQSKTQVLDLAKNTCQAAISQIDQQLVVHEELLKQREAHQATLAEKTRVKEQQSQITHEMALKVESLTAQVNATQQHASRLQKQMQAEQERLAAIEMELNQPMADEDSRQNLSTLSTQKNEVDEVVKTAKQALETLHQQEAQYLQEKVSVEQQVAMLRDQLEQERLGQKTIEERFAALNAQMIESGYNISLDEPGEPIDEKALEKNLEQIQTRITRLGPINLAAISELQEHQERKIYLDAQNEDLVLALEALESAISQIDHETKQRFKETFDAINAHFEKLFPQLFGGGQARLVLSGEDYLTAGVQVIAQPPGKRNSTIHQLSGGEKALTAIALVFALFELNPAPFCILDEVDAPLDDVNIGRFCALVKEMSSRVQFIFITHNKIAMEMAQHLIGVTMQEPGVSRLAAVNIEQALSIVDEKVAMEV